MYVVRIEHPVRDFGTWKAAFDSDPIDRKESGVQRYRILRSADESNDVLVDLELDTLAQAESVVGALQILWKRVPSDIMQSPRARILEIVESKEV